MPPPRSYQRGDIKELSPDEFKALQERYKREWDQLLATSRLSLPFPIRLPVATAAAFIGGMSLGTTYGAKKASLLYRAENAHRLPRSQRDWYFYHKTKNYKVAWAGLKEGAKLGSKLSFWVASYFCCEHVLDEFWDRNDFSNSVVASLVVSGGFSLWSEFPTLFFQDFSHISGSHETCGV